MPTERPMLLVVRTGRREFHEFMLESLSRHYRIHMFLGIEPSWEFPYTTGYTFLPDTFDTEAMVTAAQELHAREPIDGVLCWDEARIVQATRIAGALGLPGGDDEVIARCRDKRLTRETLAAAGVPQPGSIQADSLPEALAAADQFGYPVILKPRDLALSLGVVKVANAEELTSFFSFTRSMKVKEIPDYQADVLVEEFADGEEISIDIAVHQGELFPLCVARKQTGFAPYCIEIGHKVDANDPLLTDPVLLQIMRDAHAALGFTDGITHTEIKLTATGPKIIEINGRLGGDLIPYLALQASGVDIGLAAAAVACGRRPTPVTDRKLVAAIRFLYPERANSVIRSIRFDESALPPAVDRLVVLAPPGSVKSPPPEGTLAGRLALVTAVAETAEECQVAIDAATHAFDVQVEPEPQS